MIGFFFLHLAQAAEIRIPAFEQDPAVIHPPNEQRTFYAPPTEDWVVRLPGPPMNAASHTERASPVVVGDEVLVGSAAGRALYVLSRKNGSVLRSFNAIGSVEAAPAIDGDRVLFGDTAGYLWCYALDGRELWRFSTGSPILVQPTIANGQVFISNVDDLAVALDTVSGTMQWQYQRKPDLTRLAELSLFGRPPAVIQDDKVLFGFSDGFLVALDRVRGDELWARHVGEGRYPDMVAAPVDIGDRLIAAGYYGPLVALDSSGQDLLWRIDVGLSWAPLAVDEQTPLNPELLGISMLYVPGIDGKLRAVDALTGEERWIWNSKTEGALTTPIATPVGLLVASSEGALWLIDPMTGKQQWAWVGKEMLAGVSSMPTVVDDQVLFTTNAGNLYSLRVRPPETREDELRAGTFEWRRKERNW